MVSYYNNFNGRDDDGFDWANYDIEGHLQGNQTYQSVGKCGV